MTKHTPATPLPWRTVASYQPASKREEMSPYVLGADGENVAASALRGVDDAAYIAHAANAYPKLVERERDGKAHKACALLLEWIAQGEKGLPDQNTLNDAISFAQLAAKERVNLLDALGEL